MAKLFIITSFVVAVATAATQFNSDSGNIGGTHSTTNNVGPLAGAGDVIKALPGVGSPLLKVGDVTVGGRARRAATFNTDAGNTGGDHKTTNVASGSAPAPAKGGAAPSAPPTKSAMAATGDHVANIMAHAAETLKNSQATMQKLGVGDMKMPANAAHPADAKAPPPAPATGSDKFNTDMGNSGGDHHSTNIAAGAAPPAPSDSATKEAPPPVKDAPAPAPAHPAGGEVAPPAADVAAPAPTGESHPAPSSPDGHQFNTDMGNQGGDHKTSNTASRERRGY